MASIFSRVKTRLGRNGLSRTFKYIFFVVLLERCGVQVNDQFILDPTSVDVEPTTLEGFALEALNQMEQLSDSDRDFLRAYGEAAAFENRFARGQTCLVVRAEDGDIAGACWYGPLESGDDRRDGMIDHCFTRHEYRGKGLYPWALRHIAVTTTKRDTGIFAKIYTECSAFNYSSAAGIRKAGFVPTESSINVGNRTLFKW
jgi:GNAT superfamily N-acetyltransferase